MRLPYAALRRVAADLRAGVFAAAVRRAAGAFFPAGAAFLAAVFFVAVFYGAPRCS